MLKMRISEAAIRFPSAFRGSNLGGIGGQLTVETVSDRQIITSPATYHVGNDVFVAFQAPGAHCPQPGGNNQLTVLKIAAGPPPTVTTAWCGALRGRGSAIVTTTDGHSNPIVWVLGAEGETVRGALGPGTRRLADGKDLRKRAHGQFTVEENRR